MNCNAAPMWRFLCAKQFEKNVEVLVAKDDDALGVGRCALGVGRCALGVGRDALGVTRWVLKCREKKSAWTDLDQVDFEKFFKESMFKLKNWRGLV